MKSMTLKRCVLIVVVVFVLITFGRAPVIPQEQKNQEQENLEIALEIIVPDGYKIDYDFMYPEKLKKYVEERIKKLDKNRTLYPILNLKILPNCILERDLGRAGGIHQAIIRFDTQNQNKIPSELLPMRLELTHKVKGQVISEDGKPMRGIPIKVLVPTVGTTYYTFKIEYDKEYYSDEDGTFEVDLLPGEIEGHEKVRMEVRASIFFSYKKKFELYNKEYPLQDYEDCIVENIYNPICEWNNKWWYAVNVSGKVNDMLKNPPKLELRKVEKVKPFIVEVDDKPAKGFLFYVYQKINGNEFLYEAKTNENGHAYVGLLTDKCWILTKQHNNFSIPPISQEIVIEDINKLKFYTAKYVNVTFEFDKLSELLVKSADEKPRSDFLFVVEGENRQKTGNFILDIWFANSPPFLLFINPQIKFIPGDYTVKVSHILKEYPDLIIPDYYFQQSFYTIMTLKFHPDGKPILTDAYKKELEKYFKMKIVPDKIKIETDGQKINFKVESE